MALIKCPECSKEVSDKAPSCPHCGSPIAAAREQNETGVMITTIQETSKKFKLQIVLSACVFWGGLIWMWIFAYNSGTNFSMVYIRTGGLITIAGLIWYLITRFNIWWHHK
jgi:uncharacterized membrane protein YvbJ